MDFPFSILRRRGVSFLLVSLTLFLSLPWISLPFASAATPSPDHPIIKVGGIPSIPMKWLAALLAYFMVVLAGIISDPAASKFIAACGGLAGLAEALGGLGLDAVARQGRLGGFVGAAMAEAVELARIYQKSTEAGEDVKTTAVRLGISFGADLVGFVAGVAVMEAAVGAVAGAAGVVGVAGAVMAGVGGAAALTYVVAVGVDAAKNWANTLLNRAIGQ